MKELPLLGIRAVLGGLNVCLFAAVAEMVQPKKFAGIFAAAPSVAIAALALTAITKGPARMRADGLGMVAGGVGMVAYTLGVVFILPRMPALPGALVTLLAWGAAAGGAYLLFLR